MSYNSLSTGRFTASIPDRVHKPRVWKSKTPVIFMTGGGATAVDGYNFTDPIIDLIIDEGYSVVMPSVPWLAGNPTADTRIANALSYAQNTLQCANEPPIIIGVSNGALCGLSYAVDHPVTAVIGILPPIDVDYIYEQNVLGVRVNLEAAWGVTYPAPLPNEVSPYNNSSMLTNVPLQLWYASDDDISHNIVPFGTATSAELHNVGALGHTTAAISAVNATQVLNFIKSL